MVQIGQIWFHIPSFTLFLDDMAKKGEKKDLGFFLCDFTWNCPTTYLIGARAVKYTGNIQNVLEQSTTKE